MPAKKSAPKDITQIKFEFNGTEYIMEFDRDSALQTEKSFDVSLNDIRDLKLSTMQSLFHGAFLKHHPNIKQSTVNTFYDAMPNKPELFKNLAFMYSDCVNALLQDPEEGKALSWTAS